MRKLILTLTALILALALFGCGSGNFTTWADPFRRGDETAAGSETQTQTDAVTETEAVKVSWSYSLGTKTLEKEYDEDDVHLASVSFEIPVLELVSDADPAGAEPPEDMLKICDAFNARFDELYPDSYVDEICEMAKKDYYNMDEEHRASFFAYKETSTVTERRVEGDLVELTVDHYGYRGGVHGGSSRLGYHFDLASGEYFDLDYVTDDISALKEAVGNEIISQIYNNEESDKYIPGYADVIRNYDNFVFALGNDSLTVIFNEYEIAPYAAGISEFEVPYGVISRYLNDDGERLLAPSLESKAIGWYREANEMWYWFEGVIPYDVTDTKKVKQKDYDNVYYHVEIPGIDSIDDMREKMLTRMSADVVDARIASFQSGTDHPMLYEADGELYVLPMGRGGDMTIRSIDYSAKISSDGKGGTVTATIIRQDYDEPSGEWHLTGETTDVEFPFVFTGDGAVFTDFHTLW